MDGNAAQIRIMTEQVADAAATEAISRLLKVHPELSQPKSEIPPPLKWAGGIVAALLTLAVGSMAVWLVGSVSQMQVTLARMDERMSNQTGSLEARFVSVEGRVSKLEAAHAANNERGYRP